MGLKRLLLGAALGLAAAGCGVATAEPDSQSAELAQRPDDGRRQPAARENVRGEATKDRGDRRMPFMPDDDVSFIDFFVRHHEMAIQMGLAEAARGESERVRGMAEDMVAAQQTEIDLMLLIRDELTTEPRSTFVDPHTMADIEQLELAEGSEADKLFLVNMIPHHAAGLPAAHAVERLRHPTLRALAARIYESQSRQIGDMKKLLGTIDAAPMPAVAPQGREDTKLEGDLRIPLTPAEDVTFIDFFVPHHEMAITMAEQVVERGSSASVKELAKQIVAAQTRELALLKQARRALTGSEDVPPPPRDPHMEADVAELQSLSGDALDRAFLEDMIPHHASGLGPAHRGRPNLRRGDMRELSGDIFDAQAKEIGEMHLMLDEVRLRAEESAQR